MHTTVLRIGHGDVRLFHNSDFSGVSVLQTVDKDWRLHTVPLEESTARLIAASPEMLELLRMIARDCSCETFHNCDQQVEALLKRIDGDD